MALDSFPTPGSGLNASPSSGAAADPLSAIMGITSLVGLGFKVAGTESQIGSTQQTASQLTSLGYMKAGIGAQEAGAAAAYSGVQTGQEIQQIGYQQQIEQQKRVMMELSAQRMGLENLRQTQRQAAYGRAAATNQGAGYGSGEGGGQGQVAAEGGWNALGLSNSLEVGRNTFDINALISNNRVSQATSKLGFQTQLAGFQTQLSNLQGYESAVKAQGAVQQSTASGLSAIGGDIMAAAPAVAKLLPLLAL